MIAPAWTGTLKKNGSTLPALRLWKPLATCLFGAVQDEHEDQQPNTVICR
jgi:hypothetical protein